MQERIEIEIILLLFHWVEAHKKGNWPLGHTRECGRTRTSALPISMQSSLTLTLRPRRAMVEEVYLLRRGIQATSHALYWCSMFSFSLY